MKKALFILVSLSSTFSFSQKKTSKFFVDYNKNVETYFLAEILSAEHRKNNKDFELYKIKECSVYQPIVNNVLKKYEHLKNSEIAVATAKINDILMEKYGSGNDVLMKPLMYHKEFPATEWINDYQFHNNNLTEKQNKEATQLIKNYLSELSKFYTKENIGQFFIENKAFYKGGEAEYYRHIPVGFTDAMEQFYGERFDSYTILISPMMMWPIEDHEGRGIGTNIISKSGKTDIYEIASPFVRAEKQGQFGYDNQFQARFLSVHEFGHSFVNKEVYPHKDQLEKFKDLFEKSNLKEIMIKTGGYGDYQTCVAEHLVRLGEIQTAKIQKDFERAKKLEDYHLKNNFIFLPLLEEKVKEYNSNRKKYKKFGDFVPQLLEVFEKTNIEFINNALDQNKK
ncbi:Uncharacterised protein [Chryseobacterium nakagawai]|uniref:DUF4932 domain-containing protein n=1 Tax=Chryseobacterium nakagawai TaxID=1241982 RepID=A0AAD0YI37_CHRNA|nr:DUF4932 domain-containing protein [Chryseobacterium nakagawai]AZA89322.1 DUF4932 domain-containing protein [Chryseobacterium nakagawai]VEH20666.1 Uncharacterised protein [Chryseobacterium nakagawai]